MRINDFLSKTNILFEQGVKQGDVISPILFLLFMALLQHTLKAEIKDYNNSQSNMHMHCSVL